VVAVPFLFAVATFRKARGWSLLLLPPAALLMVINLVASSVRQMAILTIICAVLMVVLLVVRVQRGSALPAIAGIGLAAFAAWQISLAGNALATARFSILQNPVQAYQAQRAHNLSSITEDLQNYVFGAGLGRTGPAAVQFADAIQAHPLDGPVPLTGFMNAETYFAGMNSETGVPGLLLILAITALFIVRGAHAYWTARDPHLRAVAAAFLVLLIAALLVGAGPFTTLHPTGDEHETSRLGIERCAENRAGGRPATAIGYTWAGAKPSNGKLYGKLVSTCSLML